MSIVAGLLDTLLFLLACWLLISAIALGLVYGIEWIVRRYFE
jgi:hypothetical protein